MSSCARRLDSKIRLGKRRYERTSQFGFICGRVNFAKIRVEGEVFDAVLREVAGIVWLEGHTVVAHSLGAMTTHRVQFAWYFSILSV
jgi:hypothetical protein